jgi:hypothetical protein
MTDNPYAAPPSNSGGGIKIAILFGAVLALLAATLYLYFQVNTLQTELAQTRENLLSEVAKVRETSSVTAQTHAKRVDTLKDELAAAQRQAAAATGQARAEVEKKAEQLAAQLRAEQQKQAAAINAEVSSVKEAATAANTKIGEVSGEVSSVKTEVAATKTELEKTVADLKRVNGDLGVQSGLIATNGKELLALKQLGERNYFEFKLAKTKQPQRVGDITLLLKKADEKRNRFTVELVADDKRVEKKDKSVNEPLQFYTSKARQPYELVINEVKKDQIAGYLATPKVQSVRN